MTAGYNKRTWMTRSAKAEGLLSDELVVLDDAAEAAGSGRLRFSPSWGVAHAGDDMPTKTSNSNLKNSSVPDPPWTLLGNSDDINAHTEVCHTWKDLRRNTLTALRTVTRHDFPR